MTTEGLRLGHRQCEGRTGISVLLFSEPVACAYHVCGSAPGTRDVVLLDLGNSVKTVDALVFTGGSAFGLGATNGVMQWLREQGRGLPTPGGPVPIVPTACIFDLNVEKAVHPSLADGYEACRAAVEPGGPRGRVGAGYGARVGKGVEGAEPSHGGFGRGVVQGAGLEVQAFAVVNAFGDVIGEKGNILAGAVDEAGAFVNIQSRILAGSDKLLKMESGTNTTLVAVVTNAALSQPELAVVAKMASAGIARAVAPAFTPWDGDLVFAVSAGKATGDPLRVGTLAAEATRQAIQDAVL